MHIYKSLKLVVLVLFIATVVFFAGCVTPNTYFITFYTGPHGSISPHGYISQSGNLIVSLGSDVSFTITPDTGYSIDDVLVDGSSVGAVSSYTFTYVTQDCTISATFSVAPSPTTINIDAISGVTVPVAGENPVTAITATAQYTGTVTWVPTEDPFAEETAYTATITLTPKAGFTLTGVAENFFTVAGAVATNPTDSGVVTAIFPVTAVFPATAAAVIDIAAIPGVTAPVTGVTPVTTITATAQYTGTVTWVPTEDPFAEETAYTATITLTPKAGFTLTGVAENFFTVAGAVATNPTDSGVVTAIFPETLYK